MAKFSKLKADQLLIKEARRYLDFSELFPQSKIDARYPLTKYQRQRLKSSFNSLINFAGGKEHLARDFIPMPRTKNRQNFTKETGLPKGTKGVMIPGGKEKNKNVRFRRGKLEYKRGVHDKTLRFIPLDAKSARRFEKSMREKLEKYRHKYEFLSLATYGGEIRFTARKTDEDKMPELFIDKGMELYNRYAQMASAKLYRENGRIAAHPSTWGLGILGD